MTAAEIRHLADHPFPPDREKDRQGYIASCLGYLDCQADFKKAAVKKLFGRMQKLQKSSVRRTRQAARTNTSARLTTISSALCGCTTLK